MWPRTVIDWFAMEELIYQQIAWENGSSLQSIIIRLQGWTYEFFGVCVWGGGSGPEFFKGG